ncbi:MAG: alpha/beta hydrolase [Opitutae bacterium]|nr:alpha/beta hydrolase [Opitutae bacterium]
MKLSSFAPWCLLPLAFGLTLTAQEPTPAAKPTAAPAAKTAEPNFASQLAASLQPARSVIYKRVGTVELKLDLFFPAGFKASDQRPGLVAYHGGGWAAGSPRSMYPYAGWATDHGMVGISVQYRRFKPKTELTVFECVKDARSAMRYVRSHAAELGLDPQRLIAIGSSAGGHLAVATALFDEVNDPGDDLKVSCRPDALILLWPVIDTSTEGYGNAKIGERWRELSPLHQVRPGLPNTFLAHGTADATVPFKGAEAFHQAMLKAGNRCDFVVGPDGGHGYMMKDAAAYADALRKFEAFLSSLGLLPKPAQPGPSAK